MTAKKTAVQRVEELHEQVREVVERQLEGKWRVIKIVDRSETRYGVTLETREEPIPDYVLERVLPTFEVDLIESGPRGHTYNMECFVPCDRPGLSCRVFLASNGTLIVDHLSLVSSVR